MVLHIDKQFLTDETEYRHTEKLWRDLWERLVSDAGVREQWQYPWLGTPLRDGNPIFSAVSPGQRKGVHIIQHEPTSKELELTWWLDKFGEEGIDDIIEQLVISCALSEEAAAQAYRLIGTWVTGGRMDETELQRDKGQ